MSTSHPYRRRRRGGASPNRQESGASLFRAASPRIERRPPGDTGRAERPSTSSTSTGNCRPTGGGSPLVAHTGSIAASSNRDAARRRAARRLHLSATISFDPTYARLDRGDEQARTRIDQLVEKCAWSRPAMRTCTGSTPNRTPSRWRDVAVPRSGDGRGDEGREGAFAVCAAGLARVRAQPSTWSTRSARATRSWPG